MRLHIKKDILIQGIYIYGSKGFHNTNPYIKREISLLTTYMQEDKGLLRDYPSISRLPAWPNSLP